MASSRVVVFGRSSLSATYTRRPSGLAWIPRGRTPSTMAATTRLVATSITLTSCDASLLTNASCAWCCAAAAHGVSRAARSARRRARGKGRVMAGIYGSVSHGRCGGRDENESAAEPARAAAPRRAEVIEQVARGLVAPRRGAGHLERGGAGRGRGDVERLAELVVPATEGERAPLVPVELRGVALEIP